MRQIAVGDERLYRWHPARRDDDYMRARLAVSVAVMILSGACGSASRTGAGSTTTGSTASSNTPAETSSTAGTTTSLAPPPQTTTTTSAPPAVNLVVTSEVRNRVIAAFAEHAGIPVSYVGGTEPRSVYYGYDRATSTYWALASFYPSAAAFARHRALPAGSELSPLIQFQDSPFIFSRSPAGTWRFVTDTGGGICSPPVPKSLLLIWALRPVPAVPGSAYCATYPVF